MIDGAIEPIPPPGPDAYGNGALNTEYLGKIVSRSNRPWSVQVPPDSGTAKFVQSEENVVLDLTGLQIGLNAIVWYAVDGIPTQFRTIAVKVP